MKKNLCSLFLCMLFATPLMGMKNLKLKKDTLTKNSIPPKTFGKNVFAYQRIENNIKNFNRLRIVESRFMDNNGKLWQKVINTKGNYDIVPVVVNGKGEWVAEKQGRNTTIWNYFKKLLGKKTENPNQVRTPDFGYFSQKLHRQKKIYPKHSQFPQVYAR